VQSASRSSIGANVAQWLVPLGTAAVLSLIFFKWRLKVPSRILGAAR
jgi:lipopolysaccharide export system permease protein